MPSRVLGACLALALSVPSGAATRVVERVLAVVAGRPVLLSEVRVAQEVRGESEAEALEALIDEHLMFAEAVRLPQAALTAAEEAGALRSLTEKVPGFRDPDALARMARRQATIVKYVDFRFRPQVRVAAEDPGERARLEAAELDARIEAWVKDLRASADVRYNVNGRTVPATR